MSDEALASGGARALRAASAAAAPLIARLFTRLSDGTFHSGEDLAAELAVSRSAIWKAARSLRELGATVHAVRNRGYRLAGVAERLDAVRILASLPPQARKHVTTIETAWSVDSTNTVLLARLPPPGQAEALLAEYQTAGRGRRGRSWLAPPGGAICLSLSWTFGGMPRDLSALGLAIGVCALRALTPYELRDLHLKWPNDLLIAERKLGGTLIELRAEADGPVSVVIGIGLNVAVGAGLEREFADEGLLPVDLVRAGLQQPPRNAIAAALIAALIAGLVEFEREGLKPFIQEWLAADALRGRAVTVNATGSPVVGIARGIDLDGALLVETQQGLQRFVSGDVSVRPVS